MIRELLGLTWFIHVNFDEGINSVDKKAREELDALGSTGPRHFSDSLKISSLPNSYLSHRPKRSAWGMILSITVTALSSVSLGKKRLMSRSSLVPLRMN